MYQRIFKRNNSNGQTRGFLLKNRRNVANTIRDNPTFVYVSIAFLFWNYVNYKLSTEYFSNTLENSRQFNVFVFIFITRTVCISVILWMNITFLSAVFRWYCRVSVDIMSHLERRRICCFVAIPIYLMFSSKSLDYLFIACKFSNCYVNIWE